MKAHAFLNELISILLYNLKLKPFYFILRKHWQFGRAISETVCNTMIIELSYLSKYVMDLRKTEVISALI